MGHRGLLKWWQDSWSSSRVSSGDRFLMRCNGNAGIPFPMKQGNGPSSRDEGKMGLFLSCGGTLSVPLKWRRVCRRTLDLHQGCQGHFRGSRGKVGLLSRCRSGKGPHVALRGESPGFLELQQETWGSSLVRTGTSGTCSCGLMKVQSPCKLRGASWDSSPVSTGS